nr:hypothetical protein [Pseudenhygromyxa sp. WMMC2535]
MNWAESEEAKSYDYKNDPERKRMPAPPVHCSGCHR